MENFWIYLSIPTISAIVGMTTNWLAVQMTFYPVNFIGIGPIGWQGIIPRNSNKMAKIAVDASMRKLITVGELVDKIDPNEMIAAAQIRIDRRYCRRAHARTNQQHIRRYLSRQNLEPNTA